MKIKTMTATLAVVAILVFPAISFANTYQYVNSSGVLQSVEANSSTEALSTAYNIGIHSGVMLVSNNEIGGSYELPVVIGGSFYQYIDANGNIQSVNATNSSTALATAYNIGIHSGVILVNSGSSLTS